MPSHKIKLSPEMDKAVKYAEANGGKLVRHQGGFWADEVWIKREECFGTQTVRSLVARGVMAYTNHKDRIDGRGKFPIEASLVNIEK